jgi:putative transposase
MNIDPKILDEILKNYENPEDLAGKDGILQQLQKAILERIYDSEMTHHLGYEKNKKEGSNNSNYRNGKSRKKVHTDTGTLELEVPRDRDSSFEPQLIPKRQSRFTGFDDKIISLYARGISVRDIQDQLREMYGVEVSEGLISDVTEGIIKEVETWQARALDPVYPIIYFDALVVKVKDSGQVKNKAVYLALGVNMEGKKELLGMWIQETEGAKFWLQVLNELKNRGLKDIFIACIDGLNGFEQAIHSVYQDTQVQLCIVHMVRNSMKYVSYKDRKELAADLKTIYQSPSEESGREQLERFSEKWDKKYPLISKSWRTKWASLSPFFAYPPDIRKAIYTTNAIESLNRSLRKVLKTKGLFPSDKAVFKLLYLSLKNISRKWSMPIRNWGLALNQFGIIFEGRMPL